MALFKAREALESFAIVSALGKEGSLEKQKGGGGEAEGRRRVDERIKRIRKQNKSCLRAHHARCFKGRLILNLIVARWDSSAALQTAAPSKNTTPGPLLTPPTKPQLSVPTPPGQPPGRQRGDGAGKIKHTPGMYQHTNMASAQALHSAPLLFLQDVWGSALVTRPDANHRISDISPRPPRRHHLHAPSVELLGTVCENTAPQGSAGGPLRETRRARP